MSNESKINFEDDAESQVLRSWRILIVDDEPEILNVYAGILGQQKKVVSLQSSRTRRSVAKIAKEAPPSHDFELTMVSNGEEAVAAVKKSIIEGRPFAMGFFDVLLGSGIDGIETVRQIHEIDKRMYAVLVTAYQDRHVDSIQNVFGREFEDRWDYLNKPFSEGEILQKARNMVSMWNVRQHDIEQHEHLDFLKKRLNVGERMLTVAAVARSVSHEFGNILLQIMGRADLAKASSPAEMTKALETILLATDHASHVLERFKSLAKPHESYQRTKMDVKDAVEEAVALIEHETRTKNIEIALDLDNLPEIYGSHSTLVQVFMNLIINSIHAMKRDGRIEFASRIDGLFVELSIHDTGPGISADNLEKIFEPFFTTKGNGGSGLGLSICKEIIEINHGGHMSVRNHLKGGAEFLIMLPLWRSS